MGKKKERVLWNSALFNFVSGLALSNMAANVTNDWTEANFVADLMVLLGFFLWLRAAYLGFKYWANRSKRREAVE